jgi:alpha-ketoglutarate-dependent taurine dioxygenase
MAPSAVTHDAGVQTNGSTKATNGRSNGIKLPLQSNGSLDGYNFHDLTPCIGRDFRSANLVDMMNAPNSDELLTELAYTISSRGMVCFRKQDNLTNELQKKLILRIGALSGRPQTSGLHIHPVLNSEGEVGEQRDPDQEISTISSKLFTKVYGRSPDGALCQKKQSADQWHSDIAFEPVPADFSSLRLTEMPKTGGGT